MKILKLTQVPEFLTPHKVSAKKLLDYEHALVVVLNLKPHEKLIPHITPVDVFFYILEGKGECKIGDEIQTVEKDDIIFSPANIVHLLRNTEDQGDFKFLVVKTPKPTTETKLL